MIEIFFTSLRETNPNFPFLHLLLLCNLVARKMTGKLGFFLFGVGTNRIINRKGMIFMLESGFRSRLTNWDFFTACHDVLSLVFFLMGFDFGGTQDNFSLFLCE